MAVTRRLGIAYNHCNCWALGPNKLRVSRWVGCIHGSYWLGCVNFSAFLVGWVGSSPRVEKMAFKVLVFMVFKNQDTSKGRIFFVFVCVF